MKRFYTVLILFGALMTVAAAPMAVACPCKYQPSNEAFLKSIEQNPGPSIQRSGRRYSGVRS